MLQRSLLFVRALLPMSMPVPVRGAWCVVLYTVSFSSGSIAYALADRVICTFVACILAGLAKPRVALRTPGLQRTHVHVPVHLRMRREHCCWPLAAAYRAHRANKLVRYHTLGLRPYLQESARLRSDYLWNPRTSSFRVYCAFSRFCKCFVYTMEVYIRAQKRSE